MRPPVKENGQKIRTRSDFAAGNPLVLPGSVHARLDSGVFPCPFCGCGEVLLIGGTHACLYYRCVACAETWSAVAAAPIHSEPERRPTVH